MLTTLKNRWLVARFAPESGRLVSLAAAGVRRSLAQVWLRYHDLDKLTWHTDDPAVDGGRFEPVSFEADGRAVTSVARSAHVEVVLRYELTPDSPLLAVCATVRGLDGQARLGWMGLPRVALTPGYADVFEDDRDLYFDGAEMPGGRELPCWRVFFRKGHRSGLMLATRCKREMARFNILADAFDLEPNGRANYTADPVSTRPPLTPTTGVMYEAAFEIGPWSASQHRAILAAARLGEPVASVSLPAKGRPPRTLRGRVFHAADFAPRGAAGPEYDPRCWQVAQAPWSAKGRALFATTGVRAPDLPLSPGLTGLHRVIVGIGSGAGATLRVSGEPYPRIRLRPLVCARTRRGTFDLALSGRQSSAEVDFGVMRMDGVRLRVGRFPDRQQPCMIDYVRFEPLSPAQAAAWERQERTEPMLPLCGFADIPDIAALLDTEDPDPRTFAANVWEHANAGVRKIYWRVDGQCSDFPCKVNTMRYISAKVHGVFVPHSKAYGRALKKADLLRLAVDAARQHGVSLWGWMRFNNYTGNVQSEFFRSHPEYWEENERSGTGRQLCVAHPAVRAHKIGILVEAAGYGLDGVCLGFLRHPPAVQYAQVMRDEYKRRYGKPPPRDPKYTDPVHSFSLPDRGDPEYRRWWAFRAGYLTQFGRELRAALRDRGLGHVRVAVWVRPNHCLFDGIDMEAWLREGLCDEVVSQGYIQGNPNPEIYWETPEWKRMVRACVPLIRGFWMEFRQARLDVRRALAEGYDGLCTYESTDTALDTNFIRLFRSLRRPARGRRGKA